MNQDYIDKKIEEFTQKFVTPHDTTTRAINLNNELYVMGKAIDVESFIRQALIQDREDTLREVLKLIDKHDPNLSMARDTSPNYWGNTLRTEIKSLQDNNEG